MAVGSYEKDPSATLDWVFDFSDWLATAETISSVVWTVSPGLTVGATPNTGTNATIWLSGGSPGKIYSVACRVTTNNTIPRVDERTITIRVTDR
jgi:hypothetical protein